MIKTCSKCKQELDISAFSSEKASYCRVCMKEYDKKRNANRKEYCKEYAKTHVKEITKRYEEYYKRPEIKEAKKQYTIRYRASLTEKQKEQAKLRDREYYYKNKEKVLKRNKQYREKYSEKLKARQKLWYSKNKELIAQRNIESNRHLSKVMSRGIYGSLKENKANQHWEDLVSYTLQELKEHLEKQFTPEMSWDNYGTYWEIDHILPKNLFNFTSARDKEFHLCWSLLNLRPLNKIENRKRPKDGSDISEKLKQQILKGEKKL